MENSLGAKSKHSRRLMASRRRHLASSRSADMKTRFLTPSMAPERAETETMRRRTTLTGRTTGKVSQEQVQMYKADVMWLGGRDDGDMEAREVYWAWYADRKKHDVDVMSCGRDTLSEQCWLQDLCRSRSLRHTRCRHRMYYIFGHSRRATTPFTTPSTLVAISRSSRRRHGADLLSALVYATAAGVAGEGGGFCCRRGHSRPAVKGERSLGGELGGTLRSGREAGLWWRDSEARVGKGLVLGPDQSRWRRNGLCEYVSTSKQSGTVQ